MKRLGILYMGKPLAMMEKRYCLRCFSIGWFVTLTIQALEEAYKTIELLFGRIKSISEKAERSEQTVRYIQ